MNNEKKLLDYNVMIDYSTINIQGNNNTKSDLIYKVEKINVKNGRRIKLIIDPKSKIKINKIGLILKYEFKEDNKIFINGYQSWTDSKEVDINYHLKGLNHLPKSIINKYRFDKYGDYFFKKYPNKKGQFHSYTYSYIRDNDNYLLLASLNDYQSFTIFNYNTNQNEIFIESDLSEFEVDTKYVCLDFLELWGNDSVFENYKLYFPNLKTSNKMSGYTSWYNYYQNINETIILENIKAASENGFELFQIDDGYQTYVGDWLDIDKTKFPNGLEGISSLIHEKKMKSGIWIAPFVCEKNSKISKIHPEYIARDENGNMIEAGSNWSGFYALDTQKEEVKEYIRLVFKKYIEELNFDLVKLDFLYAAGIKHYNNKPRAAVIREAMELVRECVKGKLILGCGVPLASAFNLVDYCRVGCDVSLKYDDVWYMKFMHRERISTKNCLINTIYRRHLNGLGFLNDPDVYLLRDDNIKLSKEQKRTLAYINHLFGSMLLTSDNINLYSDENKKMYLEALKLLNAKVLNVNNKNNIIDISYILDGKQKNIRVNIKKGIMENG